MKDSEMSSRVLRAVARVPKNEKSQHHHSKPKSLPKPVPSRNSLAWYVALNKEPDNEKILCAPQVQWKCPQRFNLNPLWLVASGEESLETKAQMRRETTVHPVVYSVPSAIPPSPSIQTDVESADCNDACIPVVPIIPIEEATVEEEITLQSDASAPTINSQPLASSTLENLPLVQPQNTVGSQPQPVSDNSLLDKLRGLEGTDLEVAVAAATTVAAVMESEQQIDTELLIKLLSDPEMVMKLVDGSKSSSHPGHGSLPATLEPAFADKLTNESSNQISRFIPSNTMPPQVLNGPFSPTCTKVETVGNAQTVSSRLSLGSTHIPPNTRPLQPLVRPFSPTCTKVETSGNAQMSLSRLSHGPTHIHPSNTRPPQALDRPFSPVHTKVGMAGNAPIRAPRPPLGAAHTHQTAGVNQVRPLIPTAVRPDDETMKSSSIRQQGPPISYADKPNMDEIKKLINKYGAPDASLFDRSVGLPDDHLHRRGANSNPPFHSPNPLGNAMLRPPTANMVPPGISHFTPFPALTNTGPPFHANYNNFLNGHRIETPELQLGHNKNKPIEINHKFQKPCMFFNTSKGCRNGANCLYEHDNAAKRMKFS